MAGAAKPMHYAGRTGDLLGDAARHQPRARALYVHTPFCDTICNFCPLVKGPLAGERAALDIYVDSLLREIALKAKDAELTRLPVRAIFFGGGTPSLLEPEHIARIGAALRDAFDLTAVEEFSVEMEVKSITPEKSAAFRAIGVTHARFGAQTFNAEQRARLNLTATTDQLVWAAAHLKGIFPHVSCDILYGLHGQSGEELAADLDAAAALGLDNLDIYPLNIFVVQKKLHRIYRAAALPPLAGRTKLYMMQAVRAMMRAKGYLPHNGHGFVKVARSEIDADPVVTRSYAFRYHQHVYGPDEDEFIGLGNSALSYIAGVSIANTQSRERYVAALSQGAPVPVQVTHHSPAVNAAKIVAIGLPYLGAVPLARVRWSELPADTADLIEELIDHGLVERTAFELRLTHEGWLWYVNIMYYLAPREERAALAGLIMRDAAGPYLPAPLIEQLTAAT